MEPDPERERQRLAELYSHMADGELEELAADYAALTDPARIALKIELERRGLRVDLANSPPAIYDIEDHEIPASVSIRRFQILGEAVMAKGLLESAGITCFLFDNRERPIVDDELSLAWVPSIGGYTLKVKTEDASAAAEVLENPVPAEAGDGERKAV